MAPTVYAGRGGVVAFVVPVRAPLAGDPRHLVQAETVRPLDRRLFAGRIPRVCIPPWVQEPFLSPTSRVLPLGFGGQAAAGPPAERGGIIPAEALGRTILPARTRVLEALRPRAPGVAQGFLVRLRRHQLPAQPESPRERDVMPRLLQREALTVARHAAHLEAPGRDEHVLEPVFRVRSDHQRPSRRPDREEHKEWSAHPRRRTGAQPWRLR